MTWYADLTPYTYTDLSLSWARREEPWPDLPVVNVGWLDAVQPFPTGSPPPGLVAALTKAASAKLTRGYHLCELCKREWGSDAMEAWREGLVAYGNGELRVRGNGVVYAAPALIVHYVEEHHYLPPAAFSAAATGD